MRVSLHRADEDNQHDWVNFLGKNITIVRMLRAESYLDPLFEEIVIPYCQEFPYETQDWQARVQIEKEWIQQEIFLTTELSDLYNKRIDYLVQKGLLGESTAELLRYPELRQTMGQLAEIQSTHVLNELSKIPHGTNGD